MSALEQFVAMKPEYKPQRYKQALQEVFVESAIVFSPTLLPPGLPVDCLGNAPENLASS